MDVVGLLRTQTRHMRRAISREQRAESVEIPFDGDSRGALAAGWLGETLRDCHVVNGCPIWQTIRGQPADAAQEAGRATRSEGHPARDRSGRHQGPPEEEIRIRDS